MPSRPIRFTRLDDNGEVCYEELCTSLVKAVARLVYIAYASRDVRALSMQRYRIYRNGHEIPMDVWQNSLAIKMFKLGACLQACQWLVHRTSIKSSIHNCLYMSWSRWVLARLLAPELRAGTTYYMSVLVGEYGECASDDLFVRKELRRRLTDKVLDELVLAEEARAKALTVNSQQEGP